MAKIIFLVVFVGVFSAVRSLKYKCFGTVQYSLSFYGKWSNETHPNAFPPGGKFSPLVGCSHDKDYMMWAPGMMATDGVKYVAEMGDSSKLEGEINMAMMYNKTVWKLIKAPNGIPGTDHVMNINVEVTQDYSLVSLVTMIAPSPDWFTGIMNMDLCDTSTGMWRDSWNVTMLHPWDAGTEDGVMFNSTNEPTNPKGYITIINKNSSTPFKDVGGESIATLGMLMFKRKDMPPAMTKCQGEQKYKMKFQTKWSTDSHPTGFPSGAHFSPLVIATHTYKYQMWSDNTRASEGVEDVAETGSETKLYQEVMDYRKPNFVYKAYKTSRLEAVDETTKEIMVKEQYSRVSLISMIAPSPDWFVGVDSYDLCVNGKWEDEKKMNLMPWDAGTENGSAFASTDIETKPQGFITIINENSDTVMKAEALKPFAEVTFMKDDEPISPTPDSAQCPSAGVFTLLAIAFLATLRLMY